MEPNNARTLLDVFAWVEARLNSVELFYGHGTDNAMDEAVYIVFTIMGLEFDCPQEQLQQAPSQEHMDKIKDVVQQRIDTRKPVAYLLNRSWFAGLPFYVDERVLVPRSPLAELIEEQFVPWLEPDNVESILDIGTGSGCIAIACAHYFPKAQVDAVDVDSSALEVAHKNIELHQLNDRVRAIQSDLFSGLDNCQYDLIISNPPYVSDAEMQDLPYEYHHEPRHGLRSDDQGLAVVTRILNEAGRYLNENGLLIVEVGFSQQALMDRYPEVPFFWFEFARGGEGVFMLNKTELKRYFPKF